MPRRILVFVGFAIVAAGIFVRLGFWQISRMHERRARNAYVGDRLHSFPTPFWLLGRDSAQTHYRRASVIGTPDFEHEFYYVGRSRQGAPGVYVLTPIHVAGQDTAVLVNRGWVYAPDAQTIPAERWHAPDTLFVGYVDEFQAPSTAAAPTIASHELRSVDYHAITAQLPYPLATSYVVAVGNDSAVVEGVPMRLSIPEIDEGPHLSYAVQWFVFALIALGGATFVVLKEREARTRL